MSDAWFDRGNLGVFPKIPQSIIDHVSYSERDENVSIDFALTMSLYDRKTQFKRNKNKKKAY